MENYRFFLENVTIIYLLLETSHGSLNRDIGGWVSDFVSKKMYVHLFLCEFIQRKPLVTDFVCFKGLVGSLGISRELWGDLSAIWCEL